jgi:dUTP pyrophosphatase
MELLEMTVMLSIVRHQKEAQFPVRAYANSAALDLCAHLITPGGHSFTLTIQPNSVKLIGTGLAMRPAPGHVILVCSRSGLATRGIFVANAPGVVDPDYIGEIRVALFNGSMEPHYVKHRDRIAQILVVPFLSGNVLEVAELPETVRGTRGFGSTGD